VVNSQKTARTRYPAYPVVLRKTPSTLNHS